MWMRSCTVCKALLRKLRLCDSVRCQCGWTWVAAGVLEPVRTSAQGFMKSRRMVMAKVIEFYVPKNFPKRRKWFPQLQLGKLIEFSLQAKKSA